ncbi:MAG: TlpA family protein disulfide reductase [Opitutaceae bacterium]|nr:TlpA family protein disulfide reductase [Opitutaceae bacterium]
MSDTLTTEPSPNKSILAAIIIALVALTAAFAYVSLKSSQTTPAAEAATLEDITARIAQRYEAGGRTVADFAPEIAAIDALVDTQAQRDAEAAAAALLNKAQFYVDIIEDRASGAATLHEIRVRFPQTQTAARVPGLLQIVERATDTQLSPDQLTPGSAFPVFTATDTQGRAVDLARLRGKVVLIDFWASWCGPCIAELPEVIALHERFAARGFEVIGISLDREATALARAVNRHQIPWPQIFDGGGWENTLAGRYGVTRIPTTYLIDRNGLIVAADATPEELALVLDRLLPVSPQADNRPRPIHIPRVS